MSTREKILKISVEQFARLGFDGVKMRQLASDAQVTLPTIYHYFDNKEGLYRAVEREMYTAHAASLIDALMADAAPEERLRNFTENLVGVLVSDPDYLKLLQRNLIDGWQENNQFLVEISLQGVFDELRAILDACTPKSGNGVQPIIIFSTIIGFLTLRPVTRELENYPFARQSEKKQTQLLIDSVLSFVLQDSHA